MRPVFDRLVRTSVRKSIPFALITGALITGVTGAIAAPSDPGQPQESVAPAAGRKLLYADIAEGFLEQYGETKSSPEDFDLEAFYGEHFYALQLGLFHLRAPKGAFADRRSAEALQESCRALLDCQAGWLSWLEPLKADAAAHAAWSSTRDDLETLRSWVRAWKPRKLSKAAKAGGGDDWAALAGGEEREVLAGERFAAAMLSAEALALDREGAQPRSMLLLPQRSDFVGFVCFAGWLFPDWQQSYWSDGLASWTYCDVAGTQALALQHSDPDGRDWKAGLDMNDETPTGLRQQVTQLAARALMEDYYAERMPDAFASGLAMNLVIDLFGEVNTRIDGDLRARRTQAREVFVPGGAAQGGRLPTNVADSPWRERHGKDRFVGPLRRSQKEAFSKKRRAKNRAANFALHGDAGGTEIVEGPFLGSAAGASKAPAANYLGDYVEFLRAYKCAFTHWLRTRGTGNPKDSSQHFGALLRSLAQPAPGAFEALLAESYGLPLSAAEVATDSLEGQFQAWLAKQRGR